MGVHTAVALLSKSQFNLVDAGRFKSELESPLDSVLILHCAILTAHAGNATTPPKKCVLPTCALSVCFGWKTDIGRPVSPFVNLALPSGALLMSSDPKGGFEWADLNMSAD